jgi:hypothetical protein
MVSETLISIGETLSGRTGLIVFLIFLYFLIIFGRYFWLIHIREKFIKDIKWVILEIKIPKENLKSPKAMEQVFASLHSTYTSGIKRNDKWRLGKVEEWMSLEMAGFAHRIHFFAYVPEKYKTLVETSFFSQYPEVEIHEAEDYTDKFGNDLPNDTYDIFGTDFILARENYYPIKTYQFFEETTEERRLDSISNIFEVMSGLKDDEMIWLQLLIRPTGNTLVDKADEIINKIMGRAAKAKKGIGDELIKFIASFIMAINPLHPAEEITSSKSGGEKSPDKKAPTSGEQEILKAVENKISKLCFEMIWRFIYIDKKDSFVASNVAAIMGAMKQFSTQNLNSFRPNSGTITTPKASGKIFRKRKLLERKKKLFISYIKREMPLEPKIPFVLNFKTSILSIDELATLYHPPITSVGAPSLRHLEAKKGSAPSNLPISEN